MRVNDSRSIPKPHFKSREVPTPKGKSHGVGESSSKGNLTSVETTSTENLLSLLSQSSEVRESLVNEIKLKTAAGEYSLEKMADMTADAILRQ